jgi:hypothetical protein
VVDPRVGSGHGGPVDRASEPTAADAIRRAKRSVPLGTRPGVSWSVVLEATLHEAVPPGAVAARLEAVVAEQPRLGIAPLVEEIAPEHLATVRERFANDDYADGGPVLRAATVGARRPTLLLAGHHGAIDGLGLLTAIGLALGGQVQSSARGLAPGAAPPSPMRAAARLMRGILAPPARVVGSGSPRPGDELASIRVHDLGRGSAPLVAAAARAVRAWNESHGAGTNRLVVNVGASRRDRDLDRLTDQSTWLRVEPGCGNDRRVAVALAAARPQRPRSGFAPQSPIATKLLLFASRRLGSTLLVSSFGTVEAPANVAALDFFPVSHAGSRVAIGAASVAGRATVTLRSPAGALGARGAQRLLGLVAAQLAVPSSSDPES